MRHLLMIAYHFPPLEGSSGIQRTLRFVQHLPALGWRPIVLTAHPRAYESTSDEFLTVVPEDVPVERAFALDAARHLALFGRYPGFLARPDRWMSWKWGAVPAGMRLIRTYQPAAIWSTHPVATAHAIGAALSRRTGLPWIADFRDPMVQEGDPPDPEVRRSYKAIEEEAFTRAAHCVVVTGAAARMYRERYPDVGATRISVIENGYDEESFAAAETSMTGREPLNPGAITLLHSGIVYPWERDPTKFFQAMQELKLQGAIAPRSFRMRFRAAEHGSLLQRLARAHEIQDIVEIVPPIPYRDALQEMLRADGLVVLQASNSNAQIPAKLYEYLRAYRPILGLTDPSGETAAALRAAGTEFIARLDSCEMIASVLITFIARVRAGTVTLPAPAHVQSASRRARSEQFAALLAAICGGSEGAA